MKFFKLVKGETVLVAQVEPARSLFRRMKGLLGRKGLGVGRAMHISSCGSIHTIGMQFPIDVFFIDKNLRITSIHKDIQPGRMVFGASGSDSVIEVESGWFQWDFLREGDVVAII